MSKLDDIHDGIEASNNLNATEQTPDKTKSGNAFKRTIRRLVSPFQSAAAHLHTLMGRVPRSVKIQAVSLMALIVLGGVVGFSLDNAKNDVYISDGETVTAFATLESNTDKLLRQAGVALDLDDEIVRTEENGGKHIAIEVMRAFNVRVVADGKTQSLKMTGGDVSDALAAAGVEAGEQDILSTSIHSDLIEDMEIVLQRVLTKMVKTTEKIAYKTEKKYTATLNKGETKVQQEGKNGKKTIVTEQTIVNGKVTDSEVVSEKVTKKAVNQIILVGTKEKSVNNSSSPKNNNKSNPSTPTKSTEKNNSSKKSTEKSDSKKSNESTKKESDSGKSGGNTFVDSSGKTVTYRKLLTGSGTAYTARKGAKTSTGRLAQYGVVAVNPKKIPYGTRMYIVSSDGKYVYGYCVAGDTGSALRNGSALVDLYYGSRSQCVRFGRRNVKVYIL